MDPNTWMPVMMGGGMLMMMLLPLAILALIVVLVVWMARAMTRQGDVRTPVATETPLSVLQTRYASGEIDDEEYERKRRALTQQG